MVQFLLQLLLYRELLPCTTISSDC